MRDEPTDFDDDRGSTRPRMWKHFKAAFTTTFYVDHLAAGMESLVRAGGPGIPCRPPMLLAMALHGFLSLDAVERGRWFNAYHGWVDRLKADPDAPVFVPGDLPATASVRPGTRVVELQDGSTQHNGTVVTVLPECVIVVRDDAVLGPWERPTVALRWDEFAVHPAAPVGGVGFPAGKGADHG